MWGGIDMEKNKSEYDMFSLDESEEGKMEDRLSISWRRQDGRGTNLGGEGSGSTFRRPELALPFRGYT